jgi:DNA-binding transcriptional LysR family regulator
MDRLDAMRVVLAVADQGSFAEAARQLRITGVAASRAVAQVEADLGVALFARTTRAVRITEQGAVYLERCRRILAEVEDARRLARGENSTPRGGLTVTAPVVFGRLNVLPVVESLLAQHPTLSVRLVLSDRSVHLVEEGIDAAVRIGELADSAFTAIRIAWVRPVLVASPAYLARRSVPAEPAELAKHDLILFEGLNATDAWHFGSDGALVVHVRPRLAVTTADAAVAAAEHGVGIARALSYQVEEGVRAGRLVPVLEAYAPAAIPVSLVYPPRRCGSANLKTFVDAMRLHLGARTVGAPE